MSQFTNHTLRHILITGGAGFIGTNFVYYWQKHHPEDRIVVLDALTYAGNRTNLAEAETKSSFRFVQGDILDYDLVTKILHEERIDTIVHFAAESHVDRSIHGPDAFIQTNVVGTHTLLKAAKAAWLDAPSGSDQGNSRFTIYNSRSSNDSRFRFHHVSTDEVYGSLGPDDPPFTEETPYRPNSPYAASKAASDHLVRSYYKTYSLPVTISNCSNNFGPYQYPEKLIPLMILNMLQGKALPIYGKGANIRDWLHVEDHCRGIEAILDGGRIGQMYNIGGHGEKTNLDLVHEVCAIMDEKRPDSPYVPHASLIRHVTDRPGHDFRYAIDTRKIESELGVAPSTDFGSNLMGCVDWYLEHLEWCETVLEDRKFQDWVDIQYDR
jgi:dTDP-glucose 4,6-dehydratase